MVSERNSIPAILKRLRDMTLLEPLELDAIRWLRNWLGKQILAAISEGEFSRIEAIWHDVRVGSI
jgi:hypothetical protein